MKYTPEQLKDLHAAIDAFNKGAAVEQRYMGESTMSDDTKDWHPFEGDFTLEDDWMYRPKPEPKTRPWSKPDDVPGPICWMKFANESWGETMIVAVRPRGIVLCDIVGTARLIKWDDFPAPSSEYSTDRKTWLPCTTIEP